MTNGERNAAPPKRRTGPGRYAIVVVLLGAAAPSLAPGWMVHAITSWFGVSQFASGALNQGALAAPLIAGNCTRAALSAVEEERERVGAERDAFRRFAGDVRELSVPTRETVENPTSSAMLVETSADRQLRTVRERYRRTVMAVDHYEEEYGEDIRTNVTAEFGAELAAAVVDGAQFSRRLKRLLVERAYEAARERENVLNTLERERNSLVDARSRIREADAILEETTDRDVRQLSFSPLLERERGLRREANRCERFLEDRQRTIHRTNGPGTGDDRTALQQYLYGHLDASFPALDAVLDRTRHLRERRRTVIRELTRRC